MSRTPRRTAELRRLDRAVEDGVLVWDPTVIDYIAEEYLLSGDADIFEPTSMADAPDMSKRNGLADLLQRDFRLTRVASDRPYTTRLTVYRPKDPARFSGTLFFEVLHPSGGGSAQVWSRTYRSMARRGDGYVAIQPPLTLPGLKSANPARYGALQAEHPTQLWDALADAARLIRAGAGAAPFRGVKRQILVGYSYTGAAVAGFKNFHHDRVAQRDGQRPFDAYMPMGAGSYSAPGAVPVMRLNTQSDFGGPAGMANRIADEDDPGRGYRIYEYAGSSHKIIDPVGWPLAQPRPHVPEAAGLPVYSEETCRAGFPSGSRANDYPFYLVMAGALSNMIAWLDRGVVPPRSIRIATDSEGTAKLDDAGNAIGGIRLPQLSVPAATYGVGTDRCRLFGFTSPFAPARLSALYGGRDRYAEHVRNAANQAVADRWIEVADRDELVRSAEQVACF